MKKMLILLGWAALLMSGCLATLAFWQLRTAAETGTKAAAVSENIQNIDTQNAHVKDTHAKDAAIMDNAAKENSETIKNNGSETNKNSITADQGYAKDSEYCYQQLSAGEQTLYNDILQALLEWTEDAQIAADTKEEVFSKVFQCVLNDHPELFYVDGYTMTSYQEDGVITGQSFCGSYLYSREEAAERMARIEQKAQRIQEGVPAGSSEYEKVRYVYEYLVKNTEYVLDCEDNQNICSVFLNGKSVCLGYAKAAQYLLGRLGINAILVSGTVEGGQEHAWNIVQIDGDYYHVDVTWGDASYIAGNGQQLTKEQKPQINYEYLCVPDKQLLSTHCIKNIVPVPACDSMAANYYVQEGVYFTEPDMEKAAALFEKAYEQQAECVTLKCADTRVYQEMKQKLIDQQAVFAYLDTAAERVIYTVNEEQLILSFWLQD